MMKSCETCGVPLNKRPGCLMNCYDITDNVVTFSKWKPKENINDKKHICIDCDKENLKPDCENKVVYRDHLDNVINCAGFKQKQKLSKCELCANQHESRYTDICDDCDREENSKDNKFVRRVCGNCSFHKLGRCLSGKSGWDVTQDDKEASDYCGWEPVCETCGGTKEVCKCHEVARDRCENGYREGKYLKSCPTCQPKEERLMVPVMWRPWYRDKSSELVMGEQRLCFIQRYGNTKPNQEYYWKVSDFRYFKSNPLYGIRYESEQEAQREVIICIKQAVEKALGIEKK